jgi:hypothetical protein
MAKRTTLARASLHDLRHTCASHLVQGSWAPALIARPLRLEEVRDWLGHQDIATTQRYAHLCRDAIAALVVAGHNLDTERSRPRDLNSGPTVYETPGAARVGRGIVPDPDAVSRLVSRLRGEAVRTAEAIERGDRHRDHRALDLVAAAADLVEAHERLELARQSPTSATSRGER